MTSFVIIPLNFGREQLPERHNNEVESNLGNYGLSNWAIFPVLLIFLICNNLGVLMTNALEIANRDEAERPPNPSSPNLLASSLALPNTNLQKQYGD
ncbi:uncharacterized protein ASCRUDRAFT_7976 [Ascoidea rubescens DSM 1968]|uniref:Uncharacterized protein n=1 Tax=Ascoidea rubescens DSM 1968 TaxID=1344418 RepID=A0A1D2VHL7_9ASCO|nr:hypothetical protein ASCRUDRAFT_7976 [Ascoidea rubescens DSM 1968]ODV61003.1 hypothetical protein ASCRUDRAFT_7976 [Ascoidea rubescens DSM 1968]